MAFVVGVALAFLARRQGRSTGQLGSGSLLLVVVLFVGQVRGAQVDHSEIAFAPVLLAEQIDQGRGRGA